MYIYMHMYTYAYAYTNTYTYRYTYMHNMYTHMYMYMPSSGQPTGRRAQSMGIWLQFHQLLFQQTLAFKTNIDLFPSGKIYVLNKARVFSESIVGEMVVKSPYEESRPARLYFYYY